MGASVQLYWRGVTEGQLAKMPGFSNDCRDWADWLVEVVKDEDALEHLRALGCEAVTAFKTNGLTPEQIGWASPGDLFQAASIASRLIAEGDPSTAYLVELYTRQRYEGAAPAKALSVDLADLAKMAAHAANCGAKRVTIEVNW